MSEALLKLNKCSNELALVPAGTQPKHRIVEPKVTLMEKRIVQLDTVIAKLVSNNLRVTLSIDSYCIAEEAIPEDE